MGTFTAEVIRRHAPACWFPLSHAEAILQHPRLALRALCDSDPLALSRAASAYRVAATYGDVDRLLAEVRPALLGIATRTIGRAGLVVDAVGAGVRALHVEKPLCNGVRELASVEAALRGDAFVTYGALRRHLAPYRFARELADSGRYGSLREIRVNLGSGTLFWTHAHSIDLILFGAGERPVAGVQARLAGVVTDGSAVDIVSDPRVVSATVHFADGVTGHVTQALGSDLVLSCSEAEIAVRADGDSLEIYSNPEGGIYPVAASLAPAAAAPGPGGTLAAISQLAAALDGDPLAIAANAIVRRDLLRGQRILFAMVQSHLQRSCIVDPGGLDDAMFVHAVSGGRHA